MPVLLDEKGRPIRRGSAAAGIGDLVNEIATRERSADVMTLLGRLPDPDIILRKAGLGASALDRVQTDAHVQACTTSRKAGVKKREWNLRTPKDGVTNERARAWMEKQLERLLTDQFFNDALEAPMVGFSPLELMWGTVEEGKKAPVEIIGKPWHWFCFDIDNQPRFLSRQQPMNGEELQPRKFIFIRHQATYENPYGRKLLSACFWPYVFKKDGFKYWAIFLEKFGIPFLFGTYPGGTSQADQDVMLESLADMVQDAVGIGPDGGKVQIVESSSKGSSSAAFKEAVWAFNEEISKAILGQTLTTQMTGGSLAAATAHMDVREDLIDSDMKMIEGAVNGELIPWMEEINFGMRGIVEFYFVDEKDAGKDRAERDQILFNMGVPFKRSYFYEQYDLEEPEEGEDVVVNLERVLSLDSPQRHRGTENNKKTNDDLPRRTNSNDEGRSEGLLQRMFNIFRKEKGEGVLTVEVDGAVALQRYASRRVQRWVDSVAAAAGVKGAKEFERALRGAEMAVRESGNLMAARERRDWLDVDGGRLGAWLERAFVMARLAGHWEAEATGTALSEQMNDEYRTLNFEGRGGSAFAKASADKRGLTVPRETLRMFAADAIQVGAARLTPSPLTPEAAWKFFDGKIVMTAAEFKRLAAEAKVWAFSAASLSEISLVEALKEELDKAIRDGASFEQFRKGIRETWSRLGFAGVAPHRLDTIFQTNVQSAYQIGRWGGLQAVKDLRPWWQYDAINDGLARPSHAALDGTTLPADHPDWRIYYAPNGYRCRCSIFSLSRRDIEREGIEVADEMPKVTPDGAHSTLPDKGFDRNIAEEAWRPDLSKFPEHLRGQYAGRMEGVWESVKGEMDRGEFEERSGLR